MTPARHSQSAHQPVVFLHATGTGAASAEWIAALRRTGLELYSHRAIKGCAKTRADYGHLGLLMQEIAAAAPGRPLLLLRSPLEPGAALLGELERHLASAGPMDAHTVLSNAEPGLNPFAGLAAATQTAHLHGDLVALLGAPVLHEVRSWPGHLLALPASAVEFLAGTSTTPGNALARLQGANGRVLVSERAYLHDPSSPPFQEPALDPHESPRPAPWGGLTERLHGWLLADIGAWPDIVPGDRPATLHVTHSWGGGVAQWVDSFIAADPGGFHLQLRAEGPQSGQGAGQRLSLYAGGFTGCPVDSWWLQPPVEAVVTENPQYREVLQSVCRRFGLSRILVSSLVGHSLDALRSGMPTVHVLHDHFPAWPLFSAHPAVHGFDLAAALADPAVHQEFPGMNLEQWQVVADAYRLAVVEHEVALVAPSNSAADIQRSLGPQWADVDIAVVPHGPPPLPEAAPVAPRDREDGRLRVVIPGRVQPGKGASLLLEALPELARHAQVYLLGTGKQGERFYGLAGVNVLPEYRREDLARIVAEIGPHLAALLSLVPETYSYTLSEMTALGVPVLATRVGSFAERVRDGRDGWLIEPDAAALVAKVRELAGNAGEIDRVRENLANREIRRPADMVADYQRLCPPRKTPVAPESSAPLSLEEAQLASLHHEGSRAARLLERAAAEQARLEREVRRRTSWAEDASRDLQAEIERRKRWVAGLEADLEASRAELRENVARFDELHEELKRRTAVLEETEHTLATTRGNLARLRGELEHLQEQYSAVLHSHSWRITRPLRVARRMAGNFMRARAWNPLRWPALLAQLARNLSSVGLKGTIVRTQQGATDIPAPLERIVATPEEPGAGWPERVPRAEHPAVSIVIPVFNHLGVTASCLRSIARSSNDTPFEVIVVDDHSTEAGAGALADIEGLIVLRNESNQGFIRSSNRGAGAARGEYLVLLNNDTEVRDGWLDRLAELLRTRPDAGLVGARLIYPDGRLQECGGMVFSDGSGWNYGRGDDPERPEYLYPREVDYCSGACIMLRKDLFDELGGFDEHYAPAYYEDTDLAFRVRQHGLKVYVQPAAAIVHHEGVSSGTDETSGTKRYQAVNRDKFLARWAHELVTQPPRIEDPGDARAIRAARDHRLRGRVLVIDAYTPEPDQDSGSVRLTHILRCLRDLGYGVTFFADNRAYAGRYTRALQADGIEAWYSPWLSSAQEFFRAHGADFDFVFISRHYVAVNYLSLIGKYCPRARFVFDTVDLHYLREQRLAELESSKAMRQAARQTRRSELTVIEAADATLVVSEVEREVLARDAPGERVHLLSNIHTVNGSQAGFGERSDLFFVGGYQHPPNIDAACWFVNDIWPLIHERIPEARFHLIGSKAPDQVRNLKGEGVVFHGYVEDLDPFLDRCRLAVAPLRYGAGVKGKVNHSMSHGQPVVATPMAIEGMHAEHERDILVAEDERSFAEEVERLYRDEDLWNRLSAAAVENVRRHFSVDAARDSLERLFRDLS